MKKKIKVLFMGIHPDDVELGCGGTVALITGSIKDVVIADLSLGESSSNGTVDERRSEAMEAAKILGVAKRLNLELPDTGIQAENPEQLRKTVEVIRSIRPDIVFIPCKNDPHPDHSSGGELLERALYFAAMGGFSTEFEAFKPSLTIVYMGRLDFSPKLIVNVTGTHEIKMKAIRAHSSQFVPGDNRKQTPLNAAGFLPFLEARSRSYGGRVSAAYGEPFDFLEALSAGSIFLLSEVLRPIGSAENG